MKKLAVTLIVVLVVGASAFAQSKTVDNFHQKYKDDRDAKVVSLSGGLFNLLSAVASWDEEDEEAQAVSRIAKNIKSMDILSVPMYKTGLKDEDVDKMMSDLKGEKYEELMTARDGDEIVHFMTQGDDKSISNMVALIRDNDEFTVLNINGTVAMEDLSYLIKNHKDWH